jgi:hypothetical protein
MNIQMRIITEENIDQLMSMSYSNNIFKLLHVPEDQTKEQLERTIKNDYIRSIYKVISNKKPEFILDDVEELPIPIEEDDIKKCQHRAKLLNEIGLKLRSHGYKNIIIKECKVLFYDKDFPQ